MSKNVLFLLLFSLIFPLQSIYSCDIYGLTGIVEDNDLWIGPNDKGISSMTEEEFNDVITRIETIYKPIVREKGGELHVDRKWDDGTVNASAQRFGSKWVVNMYGGLARHEAISKDGFAMVVCHELGHHIGGLPKKKMFWSTTWAANEGQADYFGSLKCMRNYVKGDDNVALVEKMDVPEIVTKKCQVSFTTQEEIAICQRTSMAGLSLGNLFKVLKKLDKPLKFDTPDPKKVSATDHNHPAPQCRLDTYFAGSLCDKLVSDGVSETDANKGVCSRERNETPIKTRPLCWFKPGAQGGGDDGGGGGFPFPFPFPMPKPPKSAM
jgi:hypothetical protein